MTKVEIKKDLISRLDEICDNEFLFDDKGYYGINQALEVLLDNYDKNIIVNIQNLLNCLQDYKKENMKGKFEII